MTDVISHIHEPFSVHPYTNHVRVLEVKPEDGGPYIAGSITIGAGRKIVGSVDYRTLQAGYPTLQTVEEAEAVAALWIASPKLLTALMSVVDATRAYLPPDGISAQECLNRILEATDNPVITPIILDAEKRGAA